MGVIGSLILIVVPAALSEQHKELKAVALSEANVIASLFSTGAPLLVGWFAQWLGQWRFGFGVQTPNGLGNRTGTFQIVEGDVVTASVTRGRAFINFGADYRTDFTVTVEPEDMRTFRQAKFDIAGLAGKRIRVRGWVEFYNGPEITITTPAAIEVLE